MNKLEAFKALAEGKKICTMFFPDDWISLDSDGNLSWKDGTKMNWCLAPRDGWEIYEPPKKKVKKKVKAWVILYYNNLYAFYLNEHSIPGFDDKKYSKQEIEFEIELEE